MESKKILKFIETPNGFCPVQSTGYFLGYYFYFRSRGQSSSIEFYKNESDFLWINEPVKEYLLHETKMRYAAGYISKKLSYLLILKGFCKFSFYLMFN